MFSGFSDSSLGSWSFGLQCLGVAGAISVVVSLLGIHFVSAELYARTDRKIPGASSSAKSHPADPVSASPVIVVQPPPPDKVPPKVDIALAKPVQREITQEQRSAFISELNSAPKRAVPVIVYDQDPEVQSYADQIRVMLVLAGYDCGTAIRMNMVASFSPAGVLIVVKDPVHAPGFAGAIQNAFKVIGIDALGAKDDDFAQDQAAVVVGRRK